MEAVAGFPTPRYQLDREQRLETDRMVNEFNRTLNDGKRPTQALGKDDFLKILLTQLTNQDPTKPMEDREFIAQMAQFSSLEQMNNIASGIEKLGGIINSGQAFGLLGRVVDIEAGTTTITGRVEAVTGGNFPQILVNGIFYDFGRVKSVSEGETTP